MFYLSARFRKSRTAGADGAVVYIIRDGKNERNITGSVRGFSNSVMSEAKNRIAFDLMTIYCVIEKLLENEREVSIDDVAEAAYKAIFQCNPFGKRITSYANKYYVSDSVAKINKAFSDNFEREKQQVHKSTDDTSHLLGFFSYLIQEYASEGKSFAKSLKSTQHNLSRFLDGEDKPLSSVTSKFIHEYGAYLSEIVSADTVSFYLRVLRTALNKAHEAGLLPESFEWPETTKPAVSTSHRTTGRCFMDIDIIRKIEQADLSEDKSLELARDIFIFAFYAQGMELVDVVSLTSTNLSGNLLTYQRRNKGKKHCVVLGEKAMSIIEKYHDERHAYIFPLIQRQWMHSYASVRNEISVSLKEVGRRLNLTSNLTFSMNIYSWQAMAKSVNIAELLVS